MTDTINRLSDPTYVGPGTWWVTHMKAKLATNEKTIDEFINYMNFLAQHFSCKNCRKHINEYMKSHPFSDLRNLKNEEGELIGMFKWSWLFHNAVNTRIGKPYIDWETAVGMYYNEIEVCSKNCEEAGHNNQEHPEHNQQDIAKEEKINDIPISDRKSKLAQGYFMSIGIPNTLKKNGIYHDKILPEEEYVSYAIK